MGAVGAGVVDATFFNFAPGSCAAGSPSCGSARRPAALVAARCGRPPPARSARHHADVDGPGRGGGRRPGGGRRAGHAGRAPALRRQPRRAPARRSGRGAVAALHQPPRAPRRRARGGADGGRPRRPRGPRADLPRRRHGARGPPEDPGLDGGRLGRRRRPRARRGAWSTAAASPTPAGRCGPRSKRSPIAWRERRSPAWRRPIVPRSWPPSTRGDRRVALGHHPLPEPDRATAALSGGRRRLGRRGPIRPVAPQCGGVPSEHRLSSGSE